MLNDLAGPILLSFVALLIASLIAGLAAALGWCIMLDAYRTIRRKISARGRRLRRAMSTATAEYRMIPAAPPRPYRTHAAPPRVDRDRGQVYHSSTELDWWTR